MGRLKIPTCLYTSVVALLLLATVGLKCNVEGPRPTNVPPTVSFANIPADGSGFSSQPTVNWFGKDIDGFVAEYQYVVFKASQIDTLAKYVNYLNKPYIDTIGYDSFGRPIVTRDSSNFGRLRAYLQAIPGSRWIDELTKLGKTLDSLGEEVVEPVELETRQGAGQTSDLIKLFASADPEEVILQFLFLRAVDNVDAPSKVIYRTFSRTNNPPNTKINFNRDEIYYSLDQFTETWRGIPIAWSGNDSIDYPVGEPPLEYFYELFKSGVDDSTIFDTLNNNPIWISHDPEQGDQWVAITDTILPTGLETGWYMFRVRSRDDAFIVDPTPTITKFRVIKPTFERDILFVDITQYLVSRFGTVPNDTLVRNYYEQMLSQAGHPWDSLWASHSTDLAPSETILNRYKLVIVLNQNSAQGIHDTLGRQLLKYLEVGGRLWIMGINNFTNFGSFTIGERKLRSFDSERRGALLVGAKGYGCDLGKFYCGLEDYFMSGWSALADSNCVGGINCISNYDNWPPYPEGRNEEFVGADALFSGWPDLKIDTTNVKAATVRRPDKVFAFRDRVAHINYAVTYPKHPRFGDLPPAQTLYLFNSFYGASSEMNGKPTAVRYQGPTFQTAVFTFPLFFIKMDQSAEATRQMLNWFGIPLAS